MSDLSNLSNIGKNNAAQLQEVGITSVEQLRNAGSREAWLRIQAIDPSACYNRLCALEGAIQGIRWHDLAPEVKAGLKEFYNQHKI